MRVLVEKLRLLVKPRFLTKHRFFSKPGAVVSLILRVFLLLFAGIFAITQESSDSSARDNIRGDTNPGDFLSDDMFFGFQDGEEEPPPVWMPPGPPRWFRSNAGGMTLEEIPSRLAALRNKYSLVIDYVAPDEVDPRLLPFYQDGYTVEIRVLYERRQEYRRQWLFRDESGITRLNAVFKRRSDEVPENASGASPDDPQAKIEELFSEKEIIENEFIEDEFFIEDNLIEDNLVEGEPVEGEFIEEEFSDIAEGAAEGASPEETPLDEFAADPMPDIDSPDLISDLVEDETAISIGFIEIYNERSRIIEDRWLFDDNSELVISYSYHMNTLIKAETGKNIPVSEPDAEPEQYPEMVYRPMYTDTYRYNRSYSLRYVERFYHRKAEVEPVRLVFPGRVLDAAADKSFMRDKLSVRSEFLENFSVEEGYRMTYDTDSRGRILTQTLIDNKNETVWVIKNVWSGNRIVAIRKTEGDNEKLIEYEYDRNGNQVVQRDINNGVLERQVLTKGENETEELFLNGVVVLRAYWEKGRKVKEEQVRQR